MAKKPLKIGFNKKVTAAMFAGRVVPPAVARPAVAMPAAGVQPAIGLHNVQIAQFQRFKLPVFNLQLQLMNGFKTFTRDKLRVPIRAAGKLLDTTTFEMPDGTSGYLPVYRLAIEVVGSAQQYRMSIRAQGNGASVEFFLEAVPPEALDLTSNPVAVDHRINVAMSYEPGGAGVLRTLEAEVSATGTVQRARLSLNSLEQVDELINALTSERSKAAIKITRTLSNAIPVISKKPVPVRPGLIINLHQPGQVTALRQAGGGRVELTGKPASTQRYHVITSSLEQSIPILFNADRHGYIFSDFGPNTTQPGRGFIRRQVTGDTEPYFQDPIDRGVFYFLPDRYELSRTGSPDGRLWLSIVPPSEESPDKVSLSFAAVPYVERDRLETAARLLTEWAEGNEPRMMPLPYTDWTYVLKLPGQNPETRESVPDSNGQGFSDTVVVSQDQLNIIWAGISGQGSELQFGGSVEVQLPNSSSSVLIPFTPKLSDIGGGSLFGVELGDTVDGKISLRLTNVIESPLVITDLACALVVLDAAEDTEPVATELTGLIAGTVLQPEQSVELVCTAQSAVPGSDALDVLLDVSDVTIDPALDAVLEDVMHESVVVSGFSSNFVALFPPARSGTEPVNASQPVSVTVELPEHDQTFVLKPLPEGPTDAMVTVQRPMAEVLLGVPAERSIPYRYTVRRNGSIDPVVEDVTDSALTGIEVSAESPAVVDSPASA